jgi:two-component system sensor histidine kinase SenX3
MRASRLSLRLLLPLGLILLVVLLGALQYRWLGQVSEAERAQLQRTLAVRANEFAAEFDREIAVAYTVLAIDGVALDTDPWSALSTQYDAWKSRAMFPSMVRALYLARSADGGHTLAKWTPDTRTGADVDWPAHFASVKRVIAATVPRTATVQGAPVQSVIARSVGGVGGVGGVSGGAVYTMSVSPVVDSVPALILPIASRPQQVHAAGDMMWSFRMTGTDFIVVELDRQVITDAFIPALVERFFPSDDANHYRVAILDRLDERVFGRGLADDETIDQLHIDAMAFFFTGARSEFSARMLTESRLLAWQMELPRQPAGRGGSVAATPVTAEALKQAMPVPPPGGNVSVIVQEGTPGTRTQATRVNFAGWRIALQHGAGSLDEAVAQARRRNLTTSFGILGVLIAGVGLIVINARKSEKLAAQQMEFVATVSHELRTPLAVIRSAAQNLSAGVVDDPAQAKRYGDLIENEGRRLTDMVEEVLEFAGLSGNRRALALKPVDVSWLAQAVIDAHAPTLSAMDIETEVTSSPDLPLVLADEEAIRRALNNLVGNAIKYASDGRYVGIHVSRDQAAGGDDICIDVRDRGQGIASEDLPHIFEPFYRGREVVDRQIHGNGLGLSLVARIAEAHKGSVRVSSTPGAGATFTLRFPIMPATPEP